jgi:hypothetical protein
MTARLIWSVLFSWLTIIVVIGLAALALFAISPARAQPAFVYSFANITTDTTTSLKTGPGFLHNVCINTPAATGVVTLYDNTTGSGTKIGTITSYASVPICYHYDVAFWTGLTVVTATAAPDITVSFR